MRSTPRKLIGAIALGMSLTLAVVVAALVMPALFGEPPRIVVVSGQSMEPTFHTGDVVVVWPASEYAKGDVVPYQVPEGEPGEGGMVIHRVAGGNGSDGYVMLGDNNETPDIWMPTDGDMVGRQVLMIPKLGGLLVWLRQPAVLAALVAGVVVTMLLMPTRTVTTASTTRAPQDDEDVDDAATDDDDQVIDLRQPPRPLPLPAVGTGPVRLPEPA